MSAPTEPKSEVLPSDGFVREPKAPTFAKPGPWVLSTLFQKTSLALTGLFLCLFLVIHLLGNLQLFLPPESARPQFNFYSRLLAGNFVIKGISYLLFASILLHAGLALLLTLRARRAAPTRYAFDQRGASSPWHSRQMGVLGSIILLFLVLHLRDFWFQMEFGAVPLDSDGQKDLYQIVVAVCRNGWYVAFYVLCMAALAFHLLHGFQSAARTLGLHHPRWLAGVTIFGWLFSVGISTGFAAVVIFVHFYRA